MSLKFSVRNNRRTIVDNSDVWDPGPIASCNCHCVGEMSYKWHRCCQDVQCLTLGLTSILSSPDVRLYVCQPPQCCIIVIGIDVSFPDPYVSGSNDHRVYANVTGRISGQMSSELRLQLECLLQM